MPVRLLVKSKSETGDSPPQELLLRQDLITVGRDGGCAVVVNDPYVSRNHLRISRDGVLYFLEDLGSSHGTRVNGSVLPKGEKRLLRNGDVIAIGSHDLTFDRVADVGDEPEGRDKTAFVAKRVVRDALRGLGGGEGPHLRVMNGPLEGKRFELGDAQELIVGRDVDVDVQLESDDLVSRRHAKVRRDWAGTHIEDLGSRNGIRVNRNRVQHITLADRDQIDIGGTRFLYLDPSAVRESPILPGSQTAGSAGPKSVGLASDVSVPPPVAEPPEAEAPEEPQEAVEPEPEDAPEPESNEEDPESAEGEGDDDVELDDDGGFSEPSPSAAGGGGVKGMLGGTLQGVQLADGGWRNLVPVVLAVGAALFALTLLGVLFFAI